MRTTSLLLQIIVVAVAVHFACYFTYEATLPFSIINDPDLAHVSAVMNLARLFSLGPTAAFVFVTAVSILKWGAAVLLFAHIVDRAMKLDGGLVHPGIFDAAVVLTVLALALTMAGAILAVDVHTMRLTGLQLIATAVMALASDLVLYWTGRTSPADFLHQEVQDEWTSESPTVIYLAPAEDGAASLYAHRWIGRIRTASLVRWADMRSRNM